MDKKSMKYLNNLGCCSTCIKVFHGYKEFNIKDSIQDVQDNVDDVTDRSNENNEKKIKLEICTACLGLLQEGESKKAIQKIVGKVLKENHDASEFALYLSLPVCLKVRINIIWAHLLQMFPDLDITPRISHLSIIKTIWRNYMGEKISSETTKQYVPGQENSFRIDVSTVYAEDEEDCQILEKICSEKFAIRRVQHRKYNGKVFTRQAVEDALESVDDKGLIEVCSNILKQPTKPLEISNVVCSQACIYLAGRYCKFSRELPQTPWFVDGNRRFDTSVEELISNPINKLVQADGSKFSSSGREDVDVRCLGEGRPFVLEFNNPKRTQFNLDEISALMKTVNSTTSDIRVNDLQIVSRKDTSYLKLGEQEKTKSYCALCIVKKGYDVDILSKLTQMKDLVLHQTTPVRVLHRRPLLVRDRTIHKMETVPIDRHFFKLYLTSQAGTYIKEFVHGDFGRTVPNLGTLLNTPVDVIALDVENVQLNWPPKM